MKNSPNKYLVTYSVFEGNNYAGGWVDRTKLIDDLGDLDRFSYIKKVEPVYMEIGEPIHKEVYCQAIANRRHENDMHAKEKAVKDAELKLAKAKALLNT